MYTKVPNNIMVTWICVIMLKGISTIIELIIIVLNIKFLANGANFGALFFCENSSSATKTVFLAIVKGWLMIIN